MALQFGPHLPPPDLAESSRQQRLAEDAIDSLRLEEELPPCARVMGCFCAGHARGNSATLPCDTRETA